MAYHPERYFTSLKNTQRFIEQSVEFSPWQELELKKESWDNNHYIQLFADDLYEKQRRENHWNYLKKQSEAKGVFYSAKENYLQKVKFTNRNSSELTRPKFTIYDTTI